MGGSNNTVNIIGDLTINTLATLGANIENTSTTSAVNVTGNVTLNSQNSDTYRNSGIFRVGGNLIISAGQNQSLTASDGFGLRQYSLGKTTVNGTTNIKATKGRAIDNSGEILLKGNAILLSTQGNAVRNSGTITVQADPPLVNQPQVYPSLSIETLSNDYALINNGTIKSYGEFIVKSIGKAIHNGKGGIINIYNTSKLTGLVLNDQGTIAFDNSDINLIGDGNSEGLFNTNNGSITFTKNNTVVNSNNLTNTIWNDNKALISFLGDHSEIKGNVVNMNEAAISLANGVLGGKLNIDGTYTGNNGSLILDTHLANDNSPTDFVEIGGEVFGTTKVDIKSGSSQGAPTKNGIHIIQALAENQTNLSKEGVFVLAGTKGYITAGGIYDYYLEYRKNDANGKNIGTYDNWYLMNYAYEEDDYIYTPDIGEYLATETMGNTLFTSRLEDREGASQYQNLGNSKDVGNVWVRAYGGHNQFKTMNSQLKTTGNSFVTQMGTALVTLGEQDQYNLGAMTGFAYYDGKTRSSLTDRESKTKIDGYSLGFYGTWYAHPVEQRGTYIDSWVLWNKFNNSIDTPDYNKYKFNSSGVTASLEVGGDYLINKNGKKNWWVQPQSQIIYQGVHAENFQDAQGVDINHGKDNVQMRMGVKTYLDIPTSGNKFTSYRPYVALNYIQNTNPYSVVIHGERYENEGSEKQGEIKFGIEGNTTKNSQVWLNASYATGSHNNEAYQGNIGWKYNF